jgi:hypothetical protein
MELFGIEPSGVEGDARSRPMFIVLLPFAISDHIINLAFCTAIQTAGQSLLMGLVYYELFSDGWIDNCIELGLPIGAFGMRSQWRQFLIQFMHNLFF